MSRLRVEGQRAEAGELRFRETVFCKKKGVAVLASWSFLLRCHWLAWHQC